MVKNLPAMQETQVWFLGREDPLEKGMATHSSFLAWRIPWTEEPGGLPSMVLQGVRHDWATKHTANWLGNIWSWLLRGNWIFLETRLEEEKAMATHSSTLAWKIPWTEETGRLQSMGSQKVGHDWATSLLLLHLPFTFYPIVFALCGWSIRAFILFILLGWRYHGNFF